MKALYTIGLLIISNIFMTFAWYGHLKFKEFSWFSQLTLPVIIIISWSIALFEYSFQVPANKIGYIGNGGPFNLWQLKVLQRSITLTVLVSLHYFFLKPKLQNEYLILDLFRWC